MQDINATYQSILEDLEKIQQHIQLSPSNTWHYEQMYRLMNATLHKVKSDEKQKELFENKTLPILTYIMEVPVFYENNFIRIPSSIMTSPETWR